MLTKRYWERIETRMNSWENILVSPDTALQTAIGVLDRGGLQIAVVVDGERRILGTVDRTDSKRMFRMDEKQTRRELLSTLTKTYCFHS